jgi:hypothetical protein
MPRSVLYFSMYWRLPDFENSPVVLFDAIADRRPLLNASGA